MNWRIVTRSENPTLTSGKIHPESTPKA